MFRKILRGNKKTTTNKQGDFIDRVQKLRPGYKYTISELTDDDYDRGIREEFWSDDDPKCENCKHEYELKQKEENSIAEFNGKSYPIPKKYWFLIEKNLQFYQEHKK